MKEMIYRTLDSSQNQCYSSSKQNGTAKFLNSLKGIVQKERVAAVNAPAKIPATGNTQNAQAWHLTTFSSPEQLADVKKKQMQAVHEAMLRKELAKFRSEIEEKFRASETNRTYKFQKTTVETFNGDNEDTVKIDDHFDCTISVEANKCLNRRGYQGANLYRTAEGVSSRKQRQNYIKRTAPAKSEFKQQTQP